MHFVRPIFFLKYFYSKAIWRKSKQENNIYLTFDDGPIPEVTPWVLDLLLKKNIKATFFCVGDNIRKHPDIFARLKAEGHAIGNHTYNHLKGWDTMDDVYYENIAKCQELTQTRLFRPPYGRMKLSQQHELAKHYDIIMWDVLTGDYDARISPEQCFKNATEYVRNGSILVFHDNIKAIPNLKYALEKTIDSLMHRGFNFVLV
ncbi:polysaccharide deacetylase family protein [Sphingobacterium kyonggiense]